jgi:hypothetical protein
MDVYCVMDRNCDRPGDLASTALSALSGRRTDARSGTASENGAIEMAGPSAIPTPVSQNRF